MKRRAKEFRPWMYTKIIGVRAMEITADGSGVQLFATLADAQQVFPDLDPERNTERFTWATWDTLGDSDCIRFETWKAEKLLSC